MKCSGVNSALQTERYVSRSSGGRVDKQGQEYKWVGVRKREGGLKSDEREKVSNERM